MIYFRDASAHETSSVIARFRHSRHWARKAASFRHSSAMQAYQYTINLLPRLASLDLNIRQRQEALSRARGLACDACSYSIREGQFEKAVEFLCAGRGVFWAQALQLRTPLDELQSLAPHLALKLRTISNALEAPSVHDGSQPMQDGLQHTRDLEQEATRRRILNKDWNDTLEAVRKLKDFDDFLLPKSISNLRKASSNGPIVLLNAADSGCDALVVTQEEVKHIPLPDTSIKMIHDLGDILRMALSSQGTRSVTLQALLESIRTDPRLKAVRMLPAGHTPNDLFGLVLGMLWFTVARPVIDALDLKVVCFYTFLNILLLILSLNSRSRRIRTFLPVSGGVPQARLPSFQSTQLVYMEATILKPYPITPYHRIPLLWTLSSHRPLPKSMSPRHWP
jgi:hypothetical protein